MTICIEEEVEIVFRNYTPFDKEGFSQKSESLAHVEQVQKLEQSYAKKVKKQIKDYVKDCEEDPVKGLVPKKANIDLKRNLNAKLHKLKLETDRSILEILSKFLIKAYLFIKSLLLERLCNLVLQRSKLLRNEEMEFDD